jgi:cytochrome c oxidase subunit 1
MSITKRSNELPALAGADGRATPASMGVFTRPLSNTGWKSWLTSVDHKRIGIMYGFSAIFFFVVGGCEALWCRLSSTTSCSPCTAPP